MPIPDLATLEMLPRPYEILDLGDGGTKELIILDYRLGKMIIHPRPAGLPKEIAVLRVYVPESIKPLFPDYYDITAQTLIAQLLPILESGNYKDKKFIITKYGEAPKARFQVEVKPL